MFCRLLQRCMAASLLRPCLSHAAYRCLPTSFCTLTAAPGSRKLLAPPPALTVVPSNGMKMKGWLKRRCKDCYFVWREERLYVMCKTHPRHKQMSMVKPPKQMWILSHASNSPKRPWA